MICWSCVQRRRHAFGIDVESYAIFKLKFEIISNLSSAKKHIYRPWCVWGIINWRRQNVMWRRWVSFCGNARRNKSQSESPFENIKFISLKYIKGCKSFCIENGKVKNHWPEWMPSGRRIINSNQLTMRVEQNAAQILFFWFGTRFNEIMT